MPTIDELAATASGMTEPQLVAPGSIRPGGVDPLGLRQINFELMDQVLPGLNNIARHVRPFAVVSWAWRRAHQLAERKGQKSVKVGELIDFVDRVEVLFVASQMTLNSKVELPGNDYLKPLLNGSVIEFSGATWEKRRKERRYSTALSSPLNYGPGLTALGWVGPHVMESHVKLPTATALPALDALERKLEPFLETTALNQLGPVKVPRSDVESLGPCWEMDRLTAAERAVMAELLFGTAAPTGRRQTGDLMLWCAKKLEDDPSPLRVRAAMSGYPARFAAPAHLADAQAAWRRLQYRQLFRLSLEAVFYWVMTRLTDGPRSIDWLVRRFRSEAPASTGFKSTRSWLESTVVESGPVELMSRIQGALENPYDSELVRASLVGLACTLAHPDDAISRHDRLPLSRAVREVAAFAANSPHSFVEHVIQSWVLAQHAHSSVRRGLADARAGGRRLLRLRVMLDEGGWTLLPGAKRGNPPVPTADRLASALSLAGECGLLSKKA